MIDLKDLTKNIIINRSTNIDGIKVNWLKVKCFRYSKSKPNSIEYRYNHFGHYQEINVRGNSIVLRKRLEVTTTKKLYSKSLPISHDKMKDLKKL
jgi:hypothetical protein